MGLFIEAVRREYKIPIQSLCNASQISIDTFYRLKSGHDHNFNVYVRLLECFAGYCDEEGYRILEHEFFLLARAELCLLREMEMEDEVRKVWEKWTKLNLYN